MLLISCEGAEQYLDGHRLKLRIGNPLNMHFSGFKLQFNFGRKPPDFPTRGVGFQNAAEAWHQDYEAWKASLRRSEEAYIEDLPPGMGKSV